MGVGELVYPSPFSYNEGGKMVQVVEEKRALSGSKKIINAKLVTVIPNSRAEHNIYTYSTKVDTHFDIKDPVFFYPTYTFATVGDIFRVFRFEKEELINYYEFIVTNVDKMEKTVKTVVLVEKNLQKASKE